MGAMRAYNFSAGPATLPESVLRQAAEEMLDWRGLGASVVEVSHRGAEFVAMAAEVEADLRTLLAIPDDYAVVFTAGGATTLQALLPLNLASQGQAACYALTGHWGRTAIKQAKPYVSVHVSADGEGREILAILGQLLDAGYIVLPIGKDLENNRVYVWPYFAEMKLDALTPAQEVELMRLVPGTAFRGMKQTGKYTHYKLGIGADGTWHFFIR